MYKVEGPGKICSFDYAVLELERVFSDCIGTGTERTPMIKWPRRIKVVKEA
jgi:hypothetical protein